MVDQAGRHRHRHIRKIHLLNPLKRVLGTPSATLSEGYCYHPWKGLRLLSVKIDGAMHEFAVVDGVAEDVTDIVLNLKKVKFISHSRDPQTVLISVNKDGAVTAADIQLNQNLELVNPDQHICTLDKKKKFEMEMEVKVGRGFCPGDENKKQDQVIGVIPIDSIFFTCHPSSLFG